MIAGIGFMFIALISWGLWAVLYHTSKKPQTWHKTIAKVAKHEIKGGMRYKPIVEFLYDGELVRCRTDYSTTKENIHNMPLGSEIEISYCGEVIGRRYIDFFGYVYYSGIIRVEIPESRDKNKRFSKNVDNGILIISIALTLISILLIMGF